METPPPSSKRPYVFAALGVVFLAVAGTGIALLVASSQNKTFEITGDISLSGSISTYTGHPDFECEGSGGYTDIGPGTTVTVSDESGTLVAKGELDSSTGSSKACFFTFRVAEVPTGKKYYQVEVSHRGVLTYTEEEAAAGLGLSLGK